MSRVLVPGDLHAPAIRAGYLEFVLDVQEKFKTNRTVQIGDVADFHNTSFHPREVDAPGVREERQMTIDQLGPWHDALKNVEVTLGNHCRRLWRKGASASILQTDFKELNELLHLPTWKFVEEVIIDGIHYSHGEGYSGDYPAVRAARDAGRSCVIGHVHHAGGFHWLMGAAKSIFGLSVGCGVDDQHIFMRYGKVYPKKSCLSCAVVIDGEPHHIRMPCGPGEKYSRERMKKWKPIQKKTRRRR